jgi:hypothetical protein
MITMGEYCDNMFIKTPESNSDLEYILTDIPIKYSDCFKKKYNAFDLNSNDELFSDITCNCSHSYYHNYTLNGLLMEQILIIGCVLNKSRYWIYDMITSALQLHSIENAQMRKFLTSKRKILKSFIKKQIIKEIITKRIHCLKKPTYWKYELFLKFINNYFNMNKMRRIQDMIFVYSAKNSIIAIYFLQKYDIIIWCINSKTIGEIYTDMLLNGICFSGWDKLCFNKYN